MKESIITKWSEEFDPSQEFIIDFGLFSLIAKPIRLSKPGRDLTSLAPRSDKLRSDLQLKEVYQMRILEAGTAGSHFHDEKLELIYPLGDIEIYFHEIKTNQSVGILVPERINNDTRLGFFVKPGVVHTLQNPSPVSKVFYTVLSNMYEEEAEEKGDVKSYNFELPPIQPIENLLRLKFLGTSAASTSAL